jgi:hypothetical protein
MKLTAIAVKSLGAERFVEAVGRVLGTSKEHHRGHATFYEPLRDHTEKEPSETLTLNSLEEVNLVQFAGVSWDPTIMWRSLSKAHQLTAFIFDYVTKPATVLPFKRLAPLYFPQFIRRASGSTAPMRLIERFHVQRRQSWNISIAGLA